MISQLRVALMRETYRGILRWGDVVIADQSLRLIDDETFNKCQQLLQQERKESGESRSALFRRAVEMLLCRRREQEMSQRYVQAYQQIPETKEETEAARLAASAILAGETW